MRSVNKEQSLFEDGIITWSPSGQSILILNRKKLPFVLINFYKSDSIETFKRQLNLYGFKRIKGSKNIKYRHPFFCRHNPEDLYKINKRTKVIKDESYSISDSEFEELEAETSIMVKFEREIGQLKEENEMLTQRHKEIDNLFILLTNKLNKINDHFITKGTNGFNKILESYQKIMNCKMRRGNSSLDNQLILIKEIINELDTLTKRNKTTSDLLIRTHQCFRTNLSQKTVEKTSLHQSSIKNLTKLESGKLFHIHNTSLNSSDLYLDPNDCDLSVCHGIL